MLDIINSIEKSIKDENYTAALFMSMSIPDICGNVGNKPRSRNEKKKYIDWYDKFVSPRDHGSFEGVKFDGNMCYLLRCSILHSGSMEDQSVEIHQIIHNFNEKTQNYHTVDNKNLDKIKTRLEFELDYNDKNKCSHRILKKAIRDPWSNIEPLLIYTINITNLCESICLAGKDFYEKNSGLFQIKANQVKPLRINEPICLLLLTKKTSIYGLDLKIKTIEDRAEVFKVGAINYHIGDTVQLKWSWFEEYADEPDDPWLDWLNCRTLTITGVTNGYYTVNEFEPKSTEGYRAISRRDTPDIVPSNKVHNRVDISISNAQRSNIKNHTIHPRFRFVDDMFEPNFNPNSINKDFKFNERSGTISEYSGSDNDVIIPNKINGINVTKITWSIFHEKQIDSVILPNNLRVMGEGCLSDNNIKKITIPNGVEEIGYRALSGNSLEEIELPASIKSVEYLAFLNNPLKLVKLSSSTKIDKDSFPASAKIETY